ncbi:MAG: molybdenum cofactor biosynthesis protein MoaE [Thermoplasmata archaeon]
MKRIVEEDFDVASVLQELRHPEEGALALFFGSVRDNSAGKSVRRLRYEVYREMAEAYIRRIEEEVRKEVGVRRVLVLHRTGDLAPGERTIMVAAVSRHRQEAFEACRKALERVKAEAPIWKKEVYESGEAWVRHRNVDTHQED